MTMYEAVREAVKRANNATQGEMFMWSPQELCAVHAYDLGVREAVRRCYGLVVGPYWTSATIRGLIRAEFPEVFGEGENDDA